MEFWDTGIVGVCKLRCLKQYGKNRTFVTAQAIILDQNIILEGGGTYINHICIYI